MLPCIGEPDVTYMRQQMLDEFSFFLSVVLRTAVQLLQHGRAWVWTGDGKGCEVRSIGYLEPDNPLSMPARGRIKQVPLHAPDHPPLWQVVGEVSLRDESLRSGMRSAL